MTSVPTAPDIPFAVDDELPGRCLAIEASAGTGKTYALADLATRYLAESDISASELLIVTFTRAATNELRARVRERLIEVADRLEPGHPAVGDDKVARHLAAGDVARHRSRLRSAIAEFDAATITTIHGFAAQVRNALGVTGGVDPDARLIEEADDLRRQTCVDVLAAAAMGDCPPGDLPKLGDLIDATTQAAGRPDLVLEPTAEDQGATPDQIALRNLVVESMAWMTERRRMSGALSFDSVLTDLSEALTGPHSAAAVQTLRNRFKVALIDEFQDTDPVQWKIFETLFGEGPADTSLVLVGDPKQAIYGFRGGEIETYIHAVGDNAGIERRSMRANWRSDAAMLTALDVLFDGMTFGDRTIGFVPVTAARQSQDRHICDADGGPMPPLSLRLAVGGGIERTKARKEVSVPAAAAAIDKDLVARVRDLLDNAVLPAGTDGDPPRRVRPHDIAVLVNTNDQCNTVQAALTGQGVPAVVANAGNVLASPAADQMRWLLHAMARPSDPRRARTYALSWFGGWGAEQVATASDDDLTDIQEHLRDWSERLASHPVADVLARVWSASGVVARVLSSPDGDRDMTDLDHLVELLHSSTPTGRSNVAGLLATLDNSAPRSDRDTEVDGDATARRIESEAEAVQVMTVWTAKGLEFPIVCLPTLWRRGGGHNPVIYIDPDSGRKCFDVGKGKTWPDAAGAKRRKELAASATAGEQLRLLYVALTRAQHHTILWWANGQSSAKTALARLLFDAKHSVGGGTPLGAAVPIPADDSIVSSLSPLIGAAAHTIGLATIDDEPLPTRRWVDGDRTGDPGSLEAARVTVTPDRTARRWSFTAIADHAAGAASDPYDLSLGDGGAADEGSGDLDGPDGEDRPVEDQPWSGESIGPHRAGLLTRLPAGSAFGTLVHAIFERVDFRGEGDEPGRGLDVVVDRQLTAHPVDLTPVDQPDGTTEDGRRLLIDGLGMAVRTPLGSLCRGRSLADIGPGDRLNEISFDLRLGEGGRRATVADMGRVMLAHLDPADPLRPWVAGLAGGAIDAELGGHLTGSIDLILRIADGGGQRFVVADYKTNALTPRGSIPAPDDYHPARLVEAMVEHDYPLQALLYSVALHRYLRWRLPGYHPAEHLGGVAYLFVRGMTGPDVASSDGRPHGVFEWAVPPPMVVALSDLLDGQAVTGPAS